MKNSKKNFGFAGQSKAEPKVSHKHDTNLQKNTTIYFQIGLILSLLATYGLFEMQFQKTRFIVENPYNSEDSSFEVATVYRIEPVKTEIKQPKKERSKKLIDTYIPKKDIVEFVEPKIVTHEEPKINTVYSPSNIPEIKDPLDTVEDIFVGAVQIVPIYPGCEQYKSNVKRKKCMSNKIGKLISKKFNTEIGGEHSISGKQIIQTQFTIDKNGEVTNIKVRGPHPILEKEAERVIGKIPKMKPGMQQDKPVGVIYTLPITFFVKQ